MFVNNDHKSLIQLLPEVIALLLIVTLSASVAHPQRPIDKARLARQVQSEFLPAWRGYKKHAWSHDELRPLTRGYHDWYGQSLLMSSVDALDTMILMGLTDEAQQTREYVVKNLSFDKDIYVQNFEITIRLLGGLLSAYQLSGDRRLLVLAEDLGTRLLPAFESATGLPYRFVNLKTGKVRGAETNPAEAGTLLIEFGTLGKLTHQPKFYQKAKHALMEIYRRRSPLGLVGTWINVETGEWTNMDTHISGAIDSYYEYLLKCWLLFGDRDCKKMWSESISAINKYLADEVKRDKGSSPENELWYGHADMNSGSRTATTYGALDAFFPALLALSGDLERAKRLQASSFKMWLKHDIEPEEIDYQTMEVVNAGYALRPEIVESTYYLYQYTKDPAYLKMGQRLWKSFVKYCHTEAGYAHLQSVITKEKTDKMDVCTDDLGSAVHRDARDTGECSVEGKKLAGKSRANKSSDEGGGTSNHPIAGQKLVREGRRSR